MWNLPKEGEEEAEAPEGGIAGKEMANEIDYDALIKQQYEIGGMQMEGAENIIDDEEDQV